MRPANFDRAAEVVLQGHRNGAYPAAIVEVGNTQGVMWREPFGRLSSNSDSPETRGDTIFDLASLTKVIATATLAMQLVDKGRIALADPVRKWIPEWRGIDRENVTLRALLTHSSGLSSWLPLYRDYTGRRDFQHAIASLPLEYEPDTQSVYSDLGFMLLGFVLEDAGRTSFEDQGTALAQQVTAAPLLFNPPTNLRVRIAPTERDSWRGRLLVGEVHDENCWALGGAAGHAGLFGNAEAVGDFARAMLQSLKNDAPKPLASPAIVRQFVWRSAVPGSRALGWDTMLPTSSCGTRISGSGFGHTGFTGTSLWIDPERGNYVVFLTNRVHPTRDNTAIQKIRPALHDAIFDALST